MIIPSLDKVVPHALKQVSQKDRLEPSALTQGELAPDHCMQHRASWKGHWRSSLRSLAPD